MASSESKNTTSEETEIGVELLDEKIPDELAIIPIDEMVIYPHTVVPLAIVGKSSTDAIDYAMSLNKMVGALAIKFKDKSKINEEDLYEIGSVMSIHKMWKMPDGSMRLVIQGMEKMRVTQFLQKEPFFKARIEVIPEKEETGDRIGALMTTISSQYHKMVQLVPYIPDELQAAVMNIHEPLKLAYFVATMVKMKLEEGQEILEMEKLRMKARPKRN